MKLRNKYSLTILLFAITLIVSSCSAPAYRQNKYKSGHRYRDCGCQTMPGSNQSILCLNEQK